MTDFDYEREPDLEPEPPLDDDPEPPLDEEPDLDLEPSLSGVRTFAEVLGSYERERRSPEREPIRLGWPSIDAELRGVAPGQVLGIAGRTATGKTWVLASLAANLAGRPGVGVLIASLEQTAEEWTERQAGIFAHVSPAEVENWAKAGGSSAGSRASLRSSRTF